MFNMFDDESQHYQVFLDGEQIPYVFAASEEKGAVVQYLTIKREEFGLSVGITDSKGQRILVERYGKVEIRRQENPDGVIFDPAAKGDE